MSVFFFLCLGVQVSAFEVPVKPQNYVSDFANILDDAVEQTINRNLENLKNTKAVEIAVVTVPNIDGETIETTATKIFDSWSIGNAIKDTGVLVLIAPVERKIRIEVGYGIEEFITDSVSNQIIKNHTPELSTGNYSQAVAGITGDLIQGLENCSFEDLIKKSDAKFPPELGLFLLFTCFN